MYGQSESGIIITCVIDTSGGGFTSKADIMAEVRTVKCICD